MSIYVPWSEAGRFVSSADCYAAMVLWSFILHHYNQWLPVRYSICLRSMWSWVRFPPAAWYFCPPRHMQSELNFTISLLVEGATPIPHSLTSVIILIACCYRLRCLGIPEYCLVGYSSSGIIESHSSHHIGLQRQVVMGRLFVHTFLEGWVIFWHAVIYFENLHICACICENIFRVNPCVSKKFHSLPLSTAISLVNIRLVKIHQFEDCPTWETGKKTPNQWGYDVVLVDEADRCTVLRFDDTTVNHPTNYRLCANRGRQMS